MALTAGNVTIKSSGGTYSTWAAFWNDLGNLTGNISCCIDAGAYTEVTAPATVTENLNGYTIHVYPSAFPTKTDGTTGVRFTCNYTGYFLRLNNANAGTIIVEGITFLEGTSRSAYVMRFDTTAVATIKIRRCIVKGGSTAINIYSGSPTYHIYNNLFFNQAASANGIWCNITLNGFISNNTFVDLSGTNTWDGIAFNVNGASTIENNLVHNAKGADFSSVGTAATGNNNSSSDATADDFKYGANNRINKTTSPFTDYDGDDFTLLAGSDPVENGKDLSAVFTDDFFGHTRTAWDIGACAYIAPVPTYILKAWTGATWAPCALSHYTGSLFSTKQLKVYTSNGWIKID